MGRYLTGVVIFMWALVLVGGAFRPASRATGVGPQVGQEAPPLNAATRNGQAVSLSDLRGQAVFVNFWAPWCPPCRMELPAVEKIAANPPPNAVVLTINVDTAPELSERYRVLSLPTSLFIGPDGVVKARINGPLTYTAMVDYLKAAGR